MNVLNHETRKSRGVIASGRAASRQLNIVMRDLFLPIPWLCSPQIGFIPMVAMRTIGNLRFIFSQIHNCQKESASFRIA